MKLGFIGTGVITEAIVTGLLRANADIDRIIVSERTRETSHRLAALSPKISIDGNNQSIIDKSDIVVLAVRPQIAQDVLTGLDIPEHKQVVSLIAALATETLQGWLGTSATIVRAIPLPAVAELKGVTVVYPATDAALRLFRPLGPVVSATTVGKFDIYVVGSALMGTYFGLLEEVSRWMQRAGADAEGAQTYLKYMFLGLANTAKDSSDTFDALRIGHSTPKGLNEYAFEVFAEEGGLKAVDTALDKLLCRFAGQDFLKTAPSKG